MSTLAVNLTAGERRQLAHRDTGNLEAYESFLRGRSALLGGFASFNTARDLFEAAVALDSGFTQAWAALASTLVSIADVFVAPREGYPRARAAAQRALRLDPGNGEAAAALAKIALWYDWDPPGGLLLARRAVVLDPWSPETHLALGLALGLRADTVEARRALVRALELDSLSRRTVQNVIGGLSMVGQFDTAVALGRRATAAGRPEIGGALVIAALDAAGRCTEVEALAPPEALLPWCRPGTTETIDRAAARARAERPYFRAWVYARRYAAAGLADSAMTLLEQAFRDREAWMPFLHRDPLFRKLYGDPRFQDLVRRVAASAGAI